MHPAVVVSGVETVCHFTHILYISIILVFLLIRLAGGGRREMGVEVVDSIIRQGNRGPLDGLTGRAPGGPLRDSVVTQQLNQDLRPHGNNKHGASHQRVIGGIHAVMSEPAEDVRV